VSHLGWRGAYVVFGAAVLVALNGLAVLMRRDPETMGLRPDAACNGLALSLLAFTRPPAPRDETAPA
jgi:hypothetical protein